MADLLQAALPLSMQALSRHNRYTAVIILNLYAEFDLVWMELSRHPFCHQRP